MDLSQDDVLKIVKIMEESSYDELRLEFGDFKLHVQKNGAASTSTSAPRAFRAAENVAPVPPTEPPDAAASTAPVIASAPVQKPGEDAIPEGLVAVHAPMLGTFYRAPSPGERPFVEVDDRVAPDTIVCLVEVMKLFNSVKAGVAGKVVKVLAQNGALVEYGDPLVLIEPDIAEAPGAQ